MQRAAVGRYHYGILAHQQWWEDSHEFAMIRTFYCRDSSTLSFSLFFTTPPCLLTYTWGRSVRTLLLQATLPFSAVSVLLSHERSFTISCLTTLGSCGSYPRERSRSVGSKRGGHLPSTLHVFLRLPVVRRRRGVAVERGRSWRCGDNVRLHSAALRREFGGC